MPCPDWTQQRSALDICSGMEPNPGINRCHMDQQYPCIDPMFDCTFDLNPFFEALKVCEDLAMELNRCDPLQWVPCIDPSDECPFGPEYQAGLPICDLPVQYGCTGSDWGTRHTNPWDHIQQIPIDNPLLCEDNCRNRGFAFFGFECWHDPASTVVGGILFRW